MKNLEKCKLKCFTDNIDPRESINQKNPTKSGWYINITPKQLGMPPSYEIKNIWSDINIPHASNFRERYLEMLEELPDPSKTYTTKRGEWKLIYDPGDHLLKWEKQKDKMKEEFMSGLKIGDEPGTTSP